MTFCHIFGLARSLSLSLGPIGQSGILMTMQNMENTEQPIQETLDNEAVEELVAKLKKDALKTYIVQKVVDDYLECIEEIINIPRLKGYLAELETKGLMPEVLKEIILQSKVEFNFEGEDN